MGLLSFLQAGRAAVFGLLLYSGGAQAATVVMLSSFGAYGDSSGADEAAQIQEALDSGKGAMIEVRADPGRTYYFGKPLILPSNVVFNGQGSTLKPHRTLPQASGGYLRSAGEIRYEISGLSIPVRKGATQFTWNGARNLRVGEIVVVKGPPRARNPNNSLDVYHHGWLANVTAIDSATGVVTMSHPASTTFTASGIAQYTTRRWVTVTQWNLDFRDRTQGFGIGMTAVRNFVISKTTVQGTPVSSCTGGLTQGIFMAYSVSGVVDDVNVSGGVLHNCMQGEYAISPGGQDITVRNSRVSKWSSLVVAGTRTYSSTGKVLNNKLFDRGTGIGSYVNFHGNGSGLIQGNEIWGDGAGTAIPIRFDDVTVEGNTLSLTNATNADNVVGIGITETAKENVVIRNNRVSISSGTAPCCVRAIYAYGEWTRDPIRNLKIEGNLVSHPIRIYHPMAEGIAIRNNHLRAPPGFVASISLAPGASGARFDVSGNVFVNPAPQTLYNFSIQTDSSVAQQGLISYNRSYLTNCTNTRTQIVLGSTANVSRVSNVTYSCTTAPPAAPAIPVPPQ